MVPATAVYNYIFNCYFILDSLANVKTVLSSKGLGGRAGEALDFFAAARIRANRENPILPNFAKSGGLPPPREKSSKMGEKCVFWTKKCEKMAIFGIFGQKVFENCKILTSIAPRLKGGYALCKIPPIYTVLNAAFSAPPPPSGGTVVGHHSPATSHGLPEPGPTTARRVFRTRPRDIAD